MDFIPLPISGNSFITRCAPRGSSDEITYKNGLETWADPHTKISTWFKLSQGGSVTLALKVQKNLAPSTISATVGGNKYQVDIAANDTQVVLGTWEVPAGYIRLDLEGVTRVGANFAQPTHVLVGNANISSAARDEDRDNFYWTRRGPSVHAKYIVDNGASDIEWFYNEMTVLPGEDPHGTYAMAIGFEGGYFGAQVTETGQRQLIFSVWSPHRTDNPADIPPELRVKLLAKHPDQWIGDFGNEGSGSQSFMHYDWVSGVKYRYLMRVTPVGNQCTEYTAYFFFPERNRWEMLCSFLRPATDIYLKNPHSFLESFIDTNGYKYRRATYANQWAVTKCGRWLPVRSMEFTGDNTARLNLRQDYAGGVVGKEFFLANCGFFDDNVALNTVFTVDDGRFTRPDIDFI